LKINLPARQVAAIMDGAGGGKIELTLWRIMLGHKAALDIIKRGKLFRVPPTWKAKRFARLAFG